MLRYLILILIILFAAGFVLYSIFSFLFGISGTRSAFQNDVEKFKEYLLSLELSPWNLEELDLLSRNGESQKSEGIFSQTETGLIHSIYEEPIIGYAVKTYRSTAKKSIALRINDNIFHYELNGKKIFVKEDDVDIGSIEKGTDLRLNSGNTEILIPLKENFSTVPVSLNGNHVWSVRSIESPMDENLRVIECFEKYNLGDAKLFLALLAYAIVDEQI